MNSREGELRAKKEANPNSNPNPNPNPNPKLSSRQWSSHKNPRIVRVSRTFGGKDRHSKVCTVRGLRDRRIRLSVPTAIQLYDLQHRLGLSQPSKVIDWLLDATKHDIDALPPLPIIPPFHHQPPHLLPPHESLSNLGFNPTKQEVTEREHQEGFGGSFLSAQNLFPLNNNINHPSFPPYLNFQWEPPGLSLAHLGGGYPLFNQTDQDHIYMCPSATTTIPSVIPSFPSHITPSMEISTTDWRLMNNNLQQNQVLPTTLQLSSSKSARSQKHDNNQRVRGKDERS